MKSYLLDTHIILWYLRGSEELSAKARAPFDRLLTAQTLHDDLTIITHDRYITQYPVRTEF